MEFFRLPCSGAPRYSVAVHPGVAGAISVELKDVTLQEALATVGDMYGFDVQRKGNVFHVYPAGLRTETIPVNYLMMARRGLSRTSVGTGRVTANDNNNNGNNNFDSSGNNNGGNNSLGSSSGDNGSGSNSNGTRIETDSNNDYWTDLRDALQTLIGTGEARPSSPVRRGWSPCDAYPKELKAVREFLDQSGEHLKGARWCWRRGSLEVSLSEGYEQGWTGRPLRQLGRQQGHHGRWLPARQPHRLDPQPDLSGPWGAAPVFTISDGSFSVAVSLLKTQGTWNTLRARASPPPTTRKAVIRVGTDEYFVTNASTTTTTSGSSAPIVTPERGADPLLLRHRPGRDPADRRGRPGAACTSTLRHRHRGAEQDHQRRHGGSLALPLARAPFVNRIPWCRPTTATSSSSAV